MRSNDFPNLDENYKIIVESGVSFSHESDNDDLREIDQLIFQPSWEPWKKKNFVGAISGITTGWYQNPNQKLWIYLINEIILGLVVVFAQVPETISFALMAGIDPTLGLHGAWIIGLFSAIFGGRAGLVCGVTGAVASICAQMTIEYGRPELFFPIAICSGLILILFGLLNLSWILKYVSKNVMIGFCNGLAVIIGEAQFHLFQDSNGDFVTGEIAGHMSVMCICSMVIFNFWGKIPVVGQYVPASLMSLIFAGLYEYLIVVLWRDTRTVSLGDIGSLNFEWRYPQPFWSLPFVGHYSGDDIWLIFSKSWVFALVIIMETLMTVDVLDISYGNESNADQTMIGVGLGNIFSGIFGGIGGNAMIGLSNLLQRSGGCGKEASVVCGIAMMFTVMFLSEYLNYFPTAGLVGIMFVVVLHTFSFDSVAMILCSLIPSKIVKKTPWLQRRIPRMDAIIILIVTVMVPFTSLSSGIFVGTFLSAIKFVDKSSRQVQVYRHYAKREEYGTVAVYDIVGPLFFSSADQILKCFDFDADPNTIIVRMNHSSIHDYSALQILSEAKQAYEAQGKSLFVHHLTKNCENMVHLSQARMDWDKAHFEHHVMDVPRLVKYVDELPRTPGLPLNQFTEEHRTNTISSFVRNNQISNSIDESHIIGLQALNIVGEREPSSDYIYESYSDAPVV